MRRILVTGGTNFVSRFTAEYFAALGDEVYVLNRGNHPQSQGVIHLKGDRNALGNLLKEYSFDAVLDITAYSGEDVRNLTEALGSFGEYILISSSAVYPESTEKPFREESPIGYNSVWGGYGAGKIQAEEELVRLVPESYIIRPPYIYGPMQNLYREAFAFDCAEADRPFMLPEKEDMKLQFFHVEDLCRFMNLLLEKKPSTRVYNVGNAQSVTVKEWAQLCYEAAGKVPAFTKAPVCHGIRSYFCFYDYEYTLDISRMSALMPRTKPLSEGLKEEYEWYSCHKGEMIRKPYLEYIDKFMK